jgi:hypothetical protein
MGREVKRYGLVTDHSGEFISLDGQILWHGDEQELRFLFPRSRVMQLPPDLAGDPRFLRPLTEWPGVKGVVTFPLAANIDQFRTRSMAGAR